MSATSSGGTPTMRVPAAVKRPYAAIASPRAVPHAKSPNERRGRTSAIRVQKSGFGVLCSITLALDLLRRLAFGRLIVGRCRRFLRYGMHINGDSANRGEGEL